MYQRSFPKISEECLSEDGQTIITPTDIITTSDDASSVMRWVRVLKWMVRLVFWGCMLEWIMFWMTIQEALHDDIYEKIAMGRRTISIILLLIGFLMIIKIYGWDGHQLVIQLNEAECTDDPVLK